MDDVRAPDCVDIRTTVDDPEIAEQIARRVVEHRVAACAHVSAPITSFYWWEDELQRTVEYEIVVRTTRGAADAATAAIMALHPYGLPALVITASTTSAAYGRWIEEGTTGASGPLS